ncbi:cation diffusion facilitator family transporter [Haoranjiania flava]|uniref:Cation diffusion facilitator family transporter n=1 Tax=Haoranjiania flava TaxID=1856322 RepID=A0AAE3IJV4_9BACT|nr:cation diffusion facilitator family transporter [Haoranjiania flava]MCU7693442.1 cation diffusion facilitator family transporter [Haoranjiania flava]
MPTAKAKENLKVQKWIFALSVCLFIIKLVAFKITGSMAILSDALESIVNMLAGFIGLVSLFVSAMPKDKNHPYGHGKVEFLSAAAEGTMIIGAGIFIFYETIQTFFKETTVDKLDSGLMLVLATAIINYAAGYFCIKVGKRNNSVALQASGKHLQIDTYSTLGIVAGLVIILLTKSYVLDKIIAFAMGALIIYNGVKILRNAFSGIMDEADVQVLERVANVLNIHRKENWVDVHNLRVVKYGGLMHIDCHFTLPWYMNLVEAHKEINAMQRLVETEFGDSIEFFIHTDDCRQKNCAICIKSDCHVRLHAFEKKIEWTLENIANNERHSVNL